MFIGTFGRVATDLLALALEYGYQLGSVEQVPLDAQHGWKRDGTIAAGDVPESPRAPTFTPTRAGRGSRLCDGRPGRDITVRLTQQITPALSGLPAPAACTGRDKHVEELLADLAPDTGGAGERGVGARWALPGPWRTLIRGAARSSRPWLSAEATRKGAPTLFSASSVSKQRPSELPLRSDSSWRRITRP
jgi:hypothetical protein